MTAAQEGGSQEARPAASSPRQAQAQILSQPAPRSAKRAAASAAESAGGTAKRQRQQQQQEQQQQQRWQQAPTPCGLSLKDAAAVSRSTERCEAALYMAWADLVEGGATPRQRRRRLDAALVCAVQNPSPACALAAMHVLLAKGANVDASAALHVLLCAPPPAWSGADLAAAVGVLCQAGGGDPNLRSSSDSTPLELAVCLACPGHVTAAVEALVQAGADARATAAGGKTLLHVAAGENESAAGMEAAFRALLMEGVDPLARDGGGHLATHHLSTALGDWQGAVDVLADATAAAAARAARERRQLQEEREREQTCVVCLERPRTTAVVPCFHFAFCRQCAEHSLRAQRACPLCREPAAGAQAIHVA